MSLTLIVSSLSKILAVHLHTQSPYLTPFRDYQQYMCSPRCPLLYPRLRFNSMCFDLLRLNIPSPYLSYQVFWNLTLQNCYSILMACLSYPCLVQLCSHVCERIHWGIKPFFTAVRHKWFNLDADYVNNTKMGIFTFRYQPCLLLFCSSLWTVPIFSSLYDVWNWPFGYWFLFGSVLITGVEMGLNQWMTCSWSHEGRWCFTFSELHAIEQSMKLQVSN